MEPNEKLTKEKLDEGYVLLPQPVDAEAHKMLEDAGFRVVVAADTRFETVAPLMKKARAVVLRTGIALDGALISQSEDLWTISRTGGGVDNVDLESATEHGVIVTSSLGVNAFTVAEHTLTMIMALFKEVFLLDRQIRGGNFEIRYKNHPRDIQGKRLGIIGFGKIGQILAEYYQPIAKTKILAYDPLLPAQIKSEFRKNVDFVDLDTLLQEADVVSVHVPLNKYTRNMIAKEELAMMKPGAYLVNVSRGGVVHENDLAKALRDEIIRGAALDVFASEPIEKNNALLNLGNVILTPHAAALTSECVVRMATEGARRVIDLFSGTLPENIANPEVLKLEKWQHFKK